MLNLKKNFSAIVFLFLLSLSFQLMAAPSWVCGRITRVTSTDDGLMIMMNSGEVPENCVGTPYGWMLIPEEKKAMISAALLAASLKKTDVCIYTKNIVPGKWCTIGQVDIGSF